MKIVRRLLISGRVQGVGYRDSLRMKAEELGVTGWTRNLRRDCAVEAVVQGDSQAVEAIIAWANRGPPAARVTGVQVEDANGEFNSFEISPSA
jgi:acylphosphatase